MQLYVGNLSWVTLEEQLSSFFERICPVKSVNIKRHKNSNRSKGWGTVEVESAELANQCIAELNGEQLDGRAVHVRLDRNTVEAPYGGESVTVFLVNLPWESTNESVKVMCEKHNPSALQVMTNMKGRSRGFAILKFADKEAADRAIRDLDGASLLGRTLQCRYDRNLAEDSDAAKRHGSTPLSSRAET